MITKAYQTGCAGCNRSRGIDAVQGGIIPLPGDWVVNQYGGKEGYLGWLALQPRFHRMGMSELDDGELKALGPNIHRLDALLHDYWQGAFSPKDTLHRVYVVYFFESVFDEPPTNFHLHLHLIPRTELLGRLLREYPDRSVAPGSRHGINAWRMPTITSSGMFPEEYRRTDTNVNALMSWLRDSLGAG